MSIERMKAMKEAFMCAVEGQMYNLAEVDAEELGEVVDMIKDLSEAIYYCEVAKAMEESEKYEKEERYYQEGRMSSHGNQNGRMYYQDNNMPYRMNGGSMYYDGSSQPMYYNGSNGNSSSNSSNGNDSSHSSGGNNARGGGTRGFYEYEMPMHMRDEREGKSPMSRKTYMESKEMHQDKNVKLKELEKYMQELTSDMVEMIQGASPEEKQLLEKRISALATKIGQTG